MSGASERVLFIFLHLPQSPLKETAALTVADQQAKVGLPVLYGHRQQKRAGDNPAFQQAGDRTGRLAGRDDGDYPFGDLIFFRVI